MRFDEIQVKINDAILALHGGDLFHVSDLIPDELKFGGIPENVRTIQDSLQYALELDMRFEDMGDHFWRRKHNHEFRKQFRWYCAVKFAFEALGPNHFEMNNARVPDSAMILDNPMNGTILYKREE